MEKLPKQNSEKDGKLVIGDQTFERVGKVEAQRRDNIYDSRAPEPEVYFDIENGAIMSKIPEGESYQSWANRKREDADKYGPSGQRRDVIEAQRKSALESIESVDIDLTSLSQSDLSKILSSGEELKLYGWQDADNLDGAELHAYLSDELEDQVLVLHDKKAWEKGEVHTNCQIKLDAEDPEWAPFVSGKNEISAKIYASPIHPLGHNKNGLLRFSFLEVPEAYTKLMEEKKAKSE